MRPTSRPAALLAVFHEESSVVRILQETQAGDVIAFREARSLGEKVNQIATSWHEILSRPGSSKPPTRWEAFDPHIALAMTSRLAQVFDQAFVEAV